MIVVEINLVSAISPQRNKKQASIRIANSGGTETTADYKYEIKGKGGQVIKRGEIHDFPRKKKLALDLVTRVLTDARGVQ